MKTLADIPLKKLKIILRDTERLLGPAATSVRILRRAVDAKRQAAKQAREGQQPNGPETAA